MNTQDKPTPFEEGMKAASEGKPLKACPYDSRTPTGRRWINGWQHTRDQKQKEAAHAAAD